MKGTTVKRFFQETTGTKNRPGKLFVSIVGVFIVFLQLSACGTGSQQRIGAEEAKSLLENNHSVVLLDVRTQEEYAAGFIPGALLLPFDSITGITAAEVIASKGTPVIVYCRSGRRSSIAADTLRKLGYSAVYDLGAIDAWPYGLEVPN